MAKKSNAKNPPRLIATSNRIFILTTVIILCGAVAYITTQIQQHLSEENSKKAQLLLAGDMLDTLKDRLEKNKLSASVNREQYCRHAVQKFSKGPLYCYQEINIRTNSLDEDYLQQQISVLNKSNLYPDKLFENKQNTNDNNLLTYSKSAALFDLKSTMYGDILCRLHFNYNEAEINIWCSEVMSKPIYQLVD